MRQLTKEEFLELLSDRIAVEGSQKALAAKLNVSESYLSDVLKNRREPGEKILKPLGLRTATYYVKEKK